MTKTINNNITLKAAFTYCGSIRERQFTVEETQQIVAFDEIFDLGIPTILEVFTISTDEHALADIFSDEDDDCKEDYIQRLISTAAENILNMTNDVKMQTADIDDADEYILSKYYR